VESAKMTKGIEEKKENGKIKKMEKFRKHENLNLKQTHYSQHRT
jgi:hypothetical protein